MGTQLTTTTNMLPGNDNIGHKRPFSECIVLSE